MKFHQFFLCFQLNPEPIRIRIRIRNTVFMNSLPEELGAGLESGVPLAGQDLLDLLEPGTGFAATLLRPILSGYRIRVLLQKEILLL